MSQHHGIGIVIILVMLCIALFGGVKNAPSGWTTHLNNPSSNHNQAYNSNVGNQIIISPQVESEYKGVVSIDYINKNTDPSQEYLVIKMKGDKTTNVLVSGWTLKSTASGASVTIPKGTYLFFANTINSEENIYLNGGETLYLVTGKSPNGLSFKINKCSGYLTQFQKFVPYISNNCPLAKNEDLSKIPTYVINDACFDYIDSYPTCKIQTENLPASWSSECKNFIYDKMNYPSCLDIHKNDSDFYKPEWRVYLKRSDPLWKNRRENIVLYDSLGKVVDTISY